jgi:hypothetical protein
MAKKAEELGRTDERKYIPRESRMAERTVPYVLKALKQVLGILEDHLKEIGPLPAGEEPDSLRRKLEANHAGLAPLVELIEGALCDHTEDPVRIRTVGDSLRRAGIDLLRVAERLERQQSRSGMPTA